MIFITKTTNYLPNHQHSNNVNDGGSLASNVTLVNNALMENYVPAHDHSSSTLGGALSSNTLINSSVLASLLAQGIVSIQSTLYTSGSGTYTTPANTVALLVRLVGGGGGGSSDQYEANENYENINGAAGNPGEEVEVLILNPASSYSYSVGAGGAGGAADTYVSNAGSAGGNTTFGSYTANGGQGGNGVLAASSNTITRNLPSIGALGTYGGAGGAEGGSNAGQAGSNGAILVIAFIARGTV